MAENESAIERIAKAIYPSIIAQSESYNEVPLAEAFSRVRYSHLRATAMEAAIAAIEALRVPTEEMLAAADSAIPRFEPDENGHRLMGRDGALDIWRAMIDAALPLPPSTAGREG